MPILALIALGLGAWFLMGLLAVAIACAARRGDCLSDAALIGVDPSIEFAPRRRMVVDVTPVARPWAAGTPAGASVLVEAGGPLT